MKTSQGKSMSPLAVQCGMSESTVHRTTWLVKAILI